ncbi:MAG TPA: ATP-binding protein [Kofleriaceae bacterium]|jgi:PAS domain S-box-containing protein|nr:ATP-binding protein [Kofleriaceae bacterium]
MLAVDDLYDRAPSPFVTIDRRGAIVRLNLAAERLLRAPAALMTGQTMSELIAPAARAAFAGVLERIRANDAPAPIEVVLAVPGAPPVEVVIDGAMIHDGADRRAGCLLVLTDVTARRIAEGERHRLRDEVLATVAHDLRGPLNAIDLAAEHLHADPLDDRDQRFVAVIQRASHRASKLIGDLLATARNEHGTLHLDLAPVEARVLVERACDEHGLEAAARGAAIATRLPRGRVRVLADPDRIHQVLSNLIDNAIVHAAGSPITVGVTPRASDAVFAVADRGPGIPPADRERIFDRFWQGNHGHRGTGLGLAIARGIVLAHGGAMSVSSELGAGARFEFSLPRC